MAEWEDIYEAAPQSGTSASSAAPWLACLVGALLVAVVAVFLFNVNDRVGGPPGHAVFNAISPATAPAIPLPHI